MEGGSGKVVYGISNGAKKQAWGFLNCPPDNNDPITAADAGDGFLMRLGYTVVDAGWQGDVAPGSSRLFPSFPVVNGVGSPTRLEYSDRTIPAASTLTMPLEGHPNFLSYATDHTYPSHYTFTVRDHARAPHVPTPSHHW